MPIRLADECVYGGDEAVDGRNGSEPSWRDGEDDFLVELCIAGLRLAREFGRCSSV